MSSQPTVVLVPGSFSFGYIYNVVLDPLREAKGYDIQVLEPPCYPAGYLRGSKSGAAPPSMYADARYINEHVEKLADEGKEVVLVAHSYGGVPSTESLKGITKKEREQQGKKGGVVRMAYLSALAPRVGETCFQAIGESMGIPPQVGEDGWMYHTDFESLAKLTCNDIPVEAGIVQAEKMGKHFSGCFMDPITHAGYKDVPVSWFFCGKDLVVTPQVQQKAIEMIEESWVGTEREGKKVHVTKMDCDHFPFVLEDRREKVSQWIEELVKKGGDE